MTTCDLGLRPFAYHVVRCDQLPEMTELNVSGLGSSSVLATPDLDHLADLAPWVVWSVRHEVGQGYCLRFDIPFCHSLEDTQQEVHQGHYQRSRHHPPAYPQRQVLRPLRGRRPGAEDVYGIVLR